MTASHNLRRPRTDALRNRARILDVAAATFAVEGVDASMDSVAKGAGVGPATLYRHFPTRDALVAAVLEAEGPDLVREAAQIVESGVDTAEALQRWLDVLGAWMQVYNGLPEPVRTALADEDSPLQAVCQQSLDTTDVFLKAAQRSGRARPHIRALDLYLATLAAAWAAARPLADGTSWEGAAALLRSGWDTA